MKKELNEFLLHLFKIRLDRCFVINVNDIHRYIEYIQEFGNHTKTEIRQAIVQLHYDYRIEKTVSDDVYIIHKK